MGHGTICAVYITAPDMKEARKIVAHLLNARLAACANIFKISSSYWWKGEIENCCEAGIILKTTKRLVKPLIAEVKRVHPYEVPCVVSWSLEAGNPDYLDWVARETG